MAEETKRSLTKKEVVKAFWRWTFFSHANYNYERLEATGLVFAMKPVIKKLYGDRPDEYKACIQRHMQFFNTEPHIGGVIPGIVLAMEEERANGAPITDEAINGVKTGLMGPFAGIGDTLWQGTLTPILLAFGIMFPVAYICWMKGYSLGKEGIEKILGGNQLQMLITGASAMGAIVLGALSAQFVTVKCSAIIKLGALKMNVQETVFDQLFQGILPLAVTLFTLYLLKNKKMKATTVMLILVVIGVVLGAVGFLGA